MGNEKRYLVKLVAVVSMVSAGVVLADEFEANPQRVNQNRYLEAAAAAQRGDYVVAYCFWRPLAEKGDAEAQYALGWMYHNGYGLVSDDRAAKAWWEKAAAQGHTDAMFSLGTLYSVGSDTVARDYSAAMRLWVQAANAGNDNARFALRELLVQNLPELKSLTQSLRVQYPQLLSLPTPNKNPKGQQKKSSRINGESLDKATDQRVFGMNLRSEEWIAVAAGYRPEYGWAAAQLFREGGQLLVSIQR